MAGGDPTPASPQKLYLHAKTIEHHIATIFSKLGLEESTPTTGGCSPVLTWLRSDG